MLRKLTGFYASAMILAAATQAAGEYPGFAWMTNSDGGKAYLVYGSPETEEDYLFDLGCDRKKKSSHMTVYVDIAGTQIGDPIAIKIVTNAATIAVPGHIATDEMSGFHFAEAKAFEIEPVAAALMQEGVVTVETGNVVTTLPDPERSKATAKFAKACGLD
jgi:hypothetical protein